MKTKILIAFLLCLALTSLTSADWKDKVIFSLHTLDEALACAKKEKKILLLCLHVYSKYSFAIISNLEKSLNKKPLDRLYVLKKAVFFKVLMGASEPGEKSKVGLFKHIVAFKEKHKLPIESYGPTTLILDQHGNLLVKIESDLKYEGIIGDLKTATKLTRKIEKDFKASYKKADLYFKRVKPLAGVKELKEIIDTGWQGYAVFEQTKQDVKNMRIMINETKQAIDDFLGGLEDLDEDARGNKKDALTENAVDLLRFICKTYKSMAFGQSIRKTIKLLEEDKLDELEEELDVLSDVLDALPEIADKPKEDKKSEEPTKK